MSRHGPGSIAMSFLLLFVISTAAAAPRGIAVSALPGSPGGPGDPRSDEYSIDDGVGELSLGASWETLIWLNQFQVLPQNGYISEIAVAWGDVPAGHTAELLVFRDPNNDGNPQDITPVDLLWSMPITTEGGNTDTFHRYSLPRLFVGHIGDFFYVGVCARMTWPDLPARLDETSSMMRSWASGASDPAFDCADPNGALPLALIDDYGYPGNWMVRAGCEIMPGMTGVCCHPDGTCDYSHVVICADFNHGLWYPCGTCEDCPPAEACCLPDGSCEMLAPFGCVAAGGEPHGLGSDCDPNPCPPTQAVTISWGRIRMLYR